MPGIAYPNTLRRSVMAIAILLICPGLSSGVEAGWDNPSGGVITHHALSARIDTSTARISVVDTLTIVHRPEVPATESFPILLARELDIESFESEIHWVEVNEGRFRPRDFWHRPPYDEMDGYERARPLFIDLVDDQGYWPETVRVVLSYWGTVYDTLRAPEAAYARGFETTSGLIDKRGAFLCSSSFWVPHRPDERFTFRCALETPAEWHGVSQGALLSSDVIDSRRINLWDCPHPMEEIYFIGGPYQFRHEDHDGVAVMTFTYENTSEEITQRYIEGTGRYLDIYGEQIGPYPFAKFALVENFWQTGFGMPSFTLLGDRVIRLPWILDTSYGHEILHNWWGNGVFVDISDGNWCEGITVYGADYQYKETEGPKAARDYRRTSLQRYADYVSEQEEIPLRLFRQRHDFVTSSIGYDKSMMVFHQIRRLLGRDAFDASLRQFYREHLFERASWSDMFRIFESHAGRDLTAWKEQWIDRPGAPALVLTDHRLSGSEAGGYKVRATIRQQQPEPYDLLVPVRVGWDDPPAETTHVAVVSEAEAEVLIEVPSRPDWIAVDPDYDVLRKIDAAEIPPALSRTLGADTAVVIIASGLESEIAAGYETLALDWDEGAALGIYYEADFEENRFPEVPVWFFGRGPLAIQHLADLDDDWEEVVGDHPPGVGMVLAGGPADRPQNAWSLLDASGVDQIKALGRKIPHYGKYGYLVFENDKNIAKGSWNVRTSPLRARFSN